MNHFHLFTISLKKNFISILFVTFTICLVIFSKQNLLATQTGLALCANSVIPSLFPFFIATELLNYTNIISILEKHFNKIMKPFFNVSGHGAYAFIMGIISGYPVGAKIATDLRINNLCSKSESERLLAFTNNSGPLFIIGTVGISLFGNTAIGALLFITHILGSLTVGFLFRFWKLKEKNPPVFKQNNKTSFVQPKIKDLGKILSSSITKAVSSVILISGFVVFFSVVISILNNSKILYFISLLFKPISNLLNLDFAFVKPFLSGLIELTNGLQAISQISVKSISTNIVLCALLLGFGGISIMLQVFSIISKSDLSIKPYILGKILHGLFAAIYTYLFIRYIPYFNFDITPVFSNLN